MIPSQSTETVVSEGVKTTKKIEERIKNICKEASCSKTKYSW